MIWPHPSRGLSGSASVNGIAQAIAQMEGYNTAGTLAQRNNNPGNLQSGAGQIGSSGGFAVFATPDDGFAALNNQIQLNASRGLTLNQFFAGLPGVYPGYAPSADSNNPAQYASFVASQTGIDPNTPAELRPFRIGGFEPSRFACCVLRSFRGRCIRAACRFVYRAGFACYGGSFSCGGDCSRLPAELNSPSVRRTDHPIQELADDDPVLTAWLERARENAASDYGNSHTGCGLSSTLIEEFAQYGGAFPINGQRRTRLPQSE